MKIHLFRIRSTAFLAIFLAAALSTSPCAEAALLSPLAPPPDWGKLGAYAGTITATDLEHLLSTVYVPDGSWRQWITITPSEARIDPGPGVPPVTLPLALPGSPPKAPVRYWKSRGERSPIPGKPLAGLKIAIDPGHLGGRFAQMEARWFQIGKGRPVEEGEMTLIVARHLKGRLEAMGADVVLTRSRNGATTSLRPAGLRRAADASLKETGEHTTPQRLQHEAERLFYRVGEIRNRARLVNARFHPDLVVCLHFNAEEWGNPSHPVLTDKNHLHLLLCGAMSEAELRHEDERYTMLVKLLGGTHAEELGLSEAVAHALAESTGLPPFTYHGGNAIRASSNPYLWIRNLLANRLFECPVVYCEPYVMNSTPVYRRIQLGDYPGRRNVEGRMVPSIYREYSDAVARGLADYYDGGAHSCSPHHAPSASPTP